MNNENLEEEMHSCGCGEHCTCGDDCHCTENDKCCEECTCGEQHECTCGEECKEETCECTEKENYFNELLRVQAEFDNYRKRMQTALMEARQDGFIEAIENFLPALDSFKMATDMITDKNTLMGIKFIEKGILDTLSKMGVEEINATGEFDPLYHQAVDTDSTAEVESGHIVKELFKGFTYKGKVIRYSQVVVKK